MDIKAQDQMSKRPSVAEASQKERGHGFDSEAESYDIIHPCEAGKEIKMSTTLLMGENSSRIKEALTGECAASRHAVNSIQDSLLLVSSMVSQESLEYQYTRLFTHELVDCLGQPLPLQNGGGGGGGLHSAERMLEFIRRKVHSNELQQIFCDGNSQMFDKLVPQIFGPSILTFVLSYNHKNSKKSFADLKNALSIACTSSRSTNALIAVEDMSSLGKKCFENEEFKEEALDMLGMLAAQQADYVSDPTGCTASQLKVQTTTACRKGQVDETRKLKTDLNNLSCSFLTHEAQFVLLIHLKALTIKKCQPVITLAYYRSAAYHFGLTKDQANTFLNSLQQFCFVYRPTGRLSDYIFLDLQWLCDNFDKAFSKPRVFGDPLLMSWHHFNTGSVSQKLIDHIQSKTAKVSNVALPKEWLLILLEDLQLLAIFSDSDKRQAFTSIYLPDMEPEAGDVSFHSDPGIASEYFIPFRGYIPPPLYLVRLITVLSKQPNFSLWSCKSCSSAVFKLTMDDNILVKLSLWSGFVRVQFCSALTDESLSIQKKSEIAEVLNTILPTVDRIVCDGFTPEHCLTKNSHNANLRLYLTCTLEKCRVVEKHLASCHHKEGTVECVRTGLKMNGLNLPPSQWFWFNKHSVHVLTKRDIFVSLRPESYISQDGVTLDEPAGTREVSSMLQRLHKPLLTYLDQSLARIYLYQYKVLSNEQMKSLILKQQQEGEKWTVLMSKKDDSQLQSEEYEFDPFENAMDVIETTLETAGPHGIMALVATLMNTSAADDKHHKLLQGLRADKDYHKIKNAWYRSIVAD